jgi:hypothetical protein
VNQAGKTGERYSKDSIPVGADVSKSMRRHLGTQSYRESETPFAFTVMERGEQDGVYSAASGKVRGVLNQMVKSDHADTGEGPTCGELRQLVANSPQMHKATIALIQVRRYSS